MKYCLTSKYHYVLPPTRRYTHKFATMKQFATHPLRILTLRYFGFAEFASLFVLFIFTKTIVIFHIKSQAQETCQPTAGLKSTFPQTEMIYLTASLWMTCDQYVQPPPLFIFYLPKFFTVLSWHPSHILVENPLLHRRSH